MNGRPFPASLKRLLGIQLVIALLFFAMGWSHTSGTMLGRSPSWQDIVALAAPLLFVGLFGWGAVASWRKGRADLPVLLSLTPLLAALMVASLVGMV